MVSTRQMTNVNSGGISDPGFQNVGSETGGPAKFTRQSTIIASVGSQQLQDPNTAGPSTEPVPVNQTVFLLDLPQEILEKILSHLNYKNIAHLRPVSHAMDRACSTILNSTFLRLQTQMLNRFQNIKSKMPRRESARRNHPLACESDIIETIHMRLTLMQMSFGKHIERKHCCFFPGEVLDEVYRILHYIKITNKLARPYKVTDELFDLSTMAMEYFKDHIEPRLPEIAYFGADFLDFTGTFTASNNSQKYLCLDSSPLGSGSGGEETKCDESPSHNTVDPSEDHFIPEPLPQSNMVLRKRIRKIKQGMKRYNSQLSLLRQDLRACKRKTAEQQKQIAEQQKQLAEQQKQTLEYATRLDENDKKNEETSRKFSTLLQELNKCKTELQYWRSKSPATPPVCAGCGAILAPVPQEDLQALVNQGVRPEGLGIDLESPNVADSVPTDVELHLASVEQTKDSKPEQLVSTSAQQTQSKSGPAVGVNKRKATDDSKQENKKACRSSKNRAKRSKV